MPAVPESLADSPSVAIVVRKLEAAPARPLFPVSPQSGLHEHVGPRRTVLASYLLSTMPSTSASAPSSSNYSVASAVEAFETAERGASHLRSLTQSDVSFASSGPAPCFEALRSAHSKAAMLSSGEAAPVKGSFDRPLHIEGLNPTDSSPSERKLFEMTSAGRTAPFVHSLLLENIQLSQHSGPAGHSSAITSSTHFPKSPEGNLATYSRGTADTDEANLVTKSRNSLANLSPSDANVPPLFPISTAHERLPAAEEGDCSLRSSRHPLAASMSATHVAEGTRENSAFFSEKLPDPGLTAKPCDAIFSKSAAPQSESSVEQDNSCACSPYAVAKEGEDSPSADSNSPASSTSLLSPEVDDQNRFAPNLYGSASRQSFADSVCESACRASFQTLSTKSGFPRSDCERTDPEHAVAAQSRVVLSEPAMLSPLEISPATLAAPPIVSQHVTTDASLDVKPLRLRFDPSSSVRQPVGCGSTPVPIPRRGRRSDAASSQHVVSPDVQSFAGVCPTMKSESRVPQRTTSDLHTRLTHDVMIPRLPRRSFGVTVPKPFHFAGEKFHVAARKEIERQRMEAERMSSVPRKFKARPMPDFSLDPRAKMR